MIHVVMNQSQRYKFMISLLYAQMTDAEIIRDIIHRLIYTRIFHNSA